MKSMYRRQTRRPVFLAILILGAFLWIASDVSRISPLGAVLFGIGGDGHAVNTEPVEVDRIPLPGTERTKWEPGKCNVAEIEFLRRAELGLTDSIVYSRRCVKPRRSKLSAERDAVSKVQKPLITSKTRVNLTDCSHVELPPCETFELGVPSAYPSNKQYPHLIFGVASTYGRMESAIGVFAHWLSGTGAQLVGVIADAEEPGTKYNLSALEQKYHDKGIKAFIIPPTIKDRIPREGKEETGPATVEQLHFFLVRELASRATAETQWFGILDDDTFFPSLDPLSKELAQYDHKKQQWLGALSDDFGHVQAWGYMAYGGAGVFMSPPLVEAIEPRIEQCIRESTTFTGDGMLRDCIYMHTRTVLTIVHGLHQHDFREDPSGFFESAPRVLSLHHWKSWYHAPVAAMARVATRVCGDCFLQRWRFGNDTLFANGYSIAVYADGVLDNLDLSRVEGTWSHPTRDYDFAYGTLRPRLGKDKKKSYLLRDAGVYATGSSLDKDGKGKDVFRQVYVFKDEDDGEHQADVDEVVELFWDLS